LKTGEAWNAQGIDDEVVKEPSLPRSRRKEVERLSGQRMLPCDRVQGEVPGPSRVHSPI